MRYILSYIQQIATMKSGTVLTLQCQFCTTEFTYTLVRKRKRFCSPKCSDRMRIQGTSHPGYLMERPWEISEPASCIRCAEPLPIPRPSTQKYCSHRCNRRANGNRQKARPGPKMRDKLRNRLRECLLKRGIQKRNSIMEYVGCAMHELASRIESRFLPGMSWENYGRSGWHIDHIIPCASFDLSRHDHRAVCFHHLNLQPLWGMANSLKQNTHQVGISQELKDMAFRVGILVL